MSNKAYMLDTNVFNHVLDGQISSDQLARCRLLVTGVQAAELRATKNNERRSKLLAMYQEIDATRIPASSFSWGIDGAGFDEAEWNDGSGRFQNMLDALKLLDHQTKKRNRDALNQNRDILIAETAIKVGAVLVTSDENLRKVVEDFGGTAIDADKI